jgi:hypothetical protein
MADFDLLLEAEKRGILPEDKKPLLAEARKRGLIGGQPADQSAAQPEQKSFLREASAKARNSIAKELSPRGDESLGQSIVAAPRRAFNVIGDMAGGVTDIAMGGAKAAYHAITPKAMNESINKTVGGAVNQGIQAIPSGIRKPIGDVLSNREVGSALNIAAILPIGKAGKMGTEAVSPMVGKAAGKAAGALEKNLSEQVSQDTLNMVKRDFSTMSKGANGGQAKAAASHLTEKKPGFFQPTTLKTTKQDIEIAKSVEGVVDPKAHVSQNVDAIYKKIGELAEQTQSLPAQSDKALNSGKLNEVLSAAKEESNVVFAGEATKEATYNQTVKAFTDLLAKKPQTLSSVLQARKDFDKLMNDKFPGWASKFQGDNVRANAIYDVRKAANDFVAGELPEGNQFKYLLKQQSNMYRASERISVNAGAAGAIDPSKFQKLTSVMRKHPWVTAEAAAAAGAAGGLSAMAHYGFGSGLVNTITSPAALSALALYGTYKIGKTVLTSQAVKKSLIKFLRTTETKLSPAEQKAVANTISFLNNQSGKASPLLIGAGGMAVGGGAYAYFKGKDKQAVKQPDDLGSGSAYNLANTLKKRREEQEALLK